MMRLLQLPLTRTQFHTWRLKALSKSYATHTSIASNLAQSAKPGLPPVRVLGPTLWALSAAGLFYVGFAAHEVSHDVENVKRRRIYASSFITWEDVEAGKSTAMLREMFSRHSR